MGSVTKLLLWLLNSLRRRPRVILVEDRGALAGLVTVKDVLRFTHTEHASAYSSWNERRFDDAVEEAWSWTADRTDSVKEWFKRLRRH